MQAADASDPRPDQRYAHPAGVQAICLRGRPALCTAQGGTIIVDRPVLELWQRAEGKNPEEILAEREQAGFARRETQAGLDCLARAGVLEGGPTPGPSLKGGERAGTLLEEKPALDPSAFCSSGAKSEAGGKKDGLVSVVLVSYNSREWLAECLPTLFAQTYLELEILVVDNGSQDGTWEWLARQQPPPGWSGSWQVYQTGKFCSLAAALNLGVSRARGNFYLLLNPDTQLEPQAVEEMVRVAGQPACAAVAAKLRLTWAPAFLNGLGNSVGAISWGVDNGIGRLDLGQFDHWEKLPSACFAAALIPSKAWEAVGPLDEGFPMYYEDSEWCYRARLLGYFILAAPQAVVYHAFSGQTTQAAGREQAENRKLRRVTYGRLRWISRILGSGAWLRFFLAYALEDTLRMLLALVRGRWGCLGALGQGWSDFYRDLSGLRQSRQEVQQQRRISDRELLALQRGLPMPLTWQGCPLLTWDVISQVYLPWLSGGGAAPKPGGLRRLRRIWRWEGPAALLDRIGRAVQHRLR